MSDPYLPSTASLSPSQAARLGPLCDRFEAAWKVGERPRIEDFLDHLPEQDRSVLVRELLVLDVHYRRCRGEQPRPTNYQDRFPHLEADWLASVLSSSTPAPSPNAQPSVAAATESGSRLDLQAPTVPQSQTAAATNWPAVAGYEILAELGRGGMGVVYKARQTSLNRPVALKMVRAGALPVPEQLARFRREAEAVARLHHPSIVQIYEIGEHQGWPFFSMEFAEGGSLDKKLVGKSLSATEAADLVKTLAQAVDHAHQRKVIHRDLKPANVLLVDDSRPMISDFGLAKQLDSDTNLSLSGAVMGTARYMAPEQAEGRTREIGPAVDVYALGVILYELLTGRPPFQAATWQATLHQVIHDEPLPPTRLKPEVPLDLDAICLKCLEKEPGHRYASASALAEDLRRFLAGESISIKGPGEWERRVRWARHAGYELLAELGRGVLGVVYKARHVSLNRLVALKVISPRAVSEIRHLSAREFRFEVIRLARLQHPNIVPVHDVAEQDGLFYFSMGLVDGGSLAEKLNGMPQPTRQAAQLVGILARAVHYAHQQRIIHGNLKPANVLLTADGIPKLTDFSLGAGMVGKPSSTEPGGVLSNPRYAAPEQITDARPDVLDPYYPAPGFGPATDVYALGAILYELLTGRPPFLGMTAQDTLEMIRSQEPVPPSRLQSDVPHDLETICLKCLQKEPHQRYASAEALAVDLGRFLAGEPAGSLPAGNPAGPDAGLPPAVPGYEVLEPLGKGNSRLRLFKVRDVSSGRLACLKMFRGLISRADLERFRSRALKLLDGLQHPNLARVYDCGEQGDWTYVAQEFLPAGSLRHRIGREPQPIRDSALLVMILARTMQVVHDHGLIHGNLEPANVLLEADGTPRIAEVGLVNQPGWPGRGESPRVEMDHSVSAGYFLDFLGNLRYLAPEVIFSDGVSLYSDVYGLGAILYHLLTGRPPFESDSLHELMALVLSQPPAPPGQLRPGVPTELDVVCVKCLQKNPQQRYASAEALAEALARFHLAEELARFQGVGVIASQPTGEEMTQARPASFWQRLIGFVKPRSSGAK